MSKTPASDADLVARVLDGDRSAFEGLVKGHWERVYVLAAHSGLKGIGADDAVQETFVQAYRRLATLRDPAHFAGWLGQIAARVCARLGRRAARSAAVTAPLEREAPDRLPQEEAELRESRARVRDAVAALSEPYRLVVVMRFFDGMSCQQIADQLGEPVGTVWTRLHRANLLLREKLGFLGANDARGAK